MGLTVNESFTTSHGFVLSSYYMSMKDLMVKKILLYGEYEYKYIVSTNFSIWVSKEAKNTGKPTIAEKFIKLELETAPTGNVYEILYDEVKKTLTDYVDDL